MLVSAVVGAAVLFDTTTAYAFVRLSETVHSAMVFLHVLGSILFLGNIIVSAMWMSQAKRTRSAAVLHFAARSVMRADWLFTLPGIVMILVSGLLTVGKGGEDTSLAWAELALALFILSGIIWGAVLQRLQRRMLRMTAEADESGGGLDEPILGVLRRWMMWGGIATLLLVAALVLMVFKPPLWG
jgi:uncharacterized membrane protein